MRATCRVTLISGQTNNTETYARADKSTIWSHSFDADSALNILIAIMCPSLYSYLHKRTNENVGDTGATETHN